MPGTAARSDGQAASHRKRPGSAAPIPLTLRRGGLLLTQFASPPTEVAALQMFLDGQRQSILRKLGGLTDEQAMSHPTVSALSMLTLVKHVAFVERRWFQLEVAQRDIPGLWPPPDHRELEVEPGDTVASITRLYEEIIAENQEILKEVTDLGSPSPTGVNRRW